MTRRFLGFIDWRLLRYMAAVMFAAAFLLATITTAQTNHRLMDAADADRAARSAERQSAAHERDLLMAGQRRLERKYDGFLQQQKALLIWLRQQHIEVPSRFIPDENADGHTIRADKHDNGTANSGPDNPSGGGSGKASGGSTGGSGGSSGSHGKSGGKSHGGNKGGKAKAHKPHKARKAK